MIKIALFDIDCTLIPFDSFLKFIKCLVRENPLKIFRFPYLLFCGLAVFRTPERLTRFKEKWLELLKGYDNEELELLSKKFVVQQIIPFLKKDAIETIEKYRKEGYKILFATASFEFYLCHLADYLRADYFFGTKILTEGKKRKIDGVNCKGQEKINRILSVIPETEIDKVASVGFSDSMSDYPYTRIASSFYLIDKKEWKIRKVFDFNGAGKKSMHDGNK